MAKIEQTFEEKTYSRWSEIFGHFLNDARISAAIAVAGKHVPSPINSASKKDGFRFDKDFETKGGMCHDNAYGSMNGLSLIAEMTGDSTKETAHKIHQYIDGQQIDLSDIKEKIAVDQLDKKVADEEKLKFTTKTTNAILRQQSNSVIVDDYLNSRGLLAAIPYLNSEAIKGVDSLYYDKDTATPAMVAQVKNNDGNLLFLHRTYLDSEHKKNQSLEQSKKVTSALSANAYQNPYSVQVNNAKPSDTEFVTEGIETALAVSVIDKNKTPVLSTINTGGMIKYQPKAGVKNVVIWADNDEPGLKAAKTLAEKLDKQGINVDIKQPLTAGHDFLDALNAKEHLQAVNVDINTGSDQGESIPKQEGVGRNGDELDKQGAQPTTMFSDLDLKNKSNNINTNNQTEQKMADNNTNINDDEVANIPELTLRQRFFINLAGSNAPSFILNFASRLGQNEQSRYLALIGAINSSSNKHLNRLSSGVNINMKDSLDNTALMHAVSAKNIQAVNLLLEKGADINTTDNNKNTPLIAAITLGNNSIAQSIINQGKLDKNISLNAINDFKDSALSLAVKNNNTQIVKTLLENNANPTIGNNPVILAARQSEEMLAIFASKKSLSQKDKDGKTALMVAIVGQESKKTISNLITNMASKDLNIKDNTGKTALMNAVNMHDSASIITLSKNSNVNVQDDNGKTALMYAIRNEDIKSVKHLIANQADVNLQDKTGNTALIHAVESANKKLTKTLIKSGVDVNQQTKLGDTALISAAKDNNVKAIIALVAAGADLSIKNKHGKTAEDSVKKLSIANIAFKAIRAAQSTKNALSKNVQNISQTLEQIKKDINPLSAKEKALTAVQKMQKETKTKSLDRVH